MASIPVHYYGFSSIEELKACFRFPPHMDGPLVYERAFEDGMELSWPTPNGGPVHVIWFVGRARRPGEPTTLSAAEVERRVATASR